MVCAGNSVAQCSSDGDSSSAVMECAPGTCMQSGSTAECVGGGTGGTGGGTGGTGGVPPTGGAGGTDTCIPTLIDDMEQGLNGALIPCDGRDGAWYTYNDMCATSTQTPIPAPGLGFPYAPEGANASTHSVRTYGSNCSVEGAWGAGIGFDLVNPTFGTTSKVAYDASRYSGIQFWAKAGTTGTPYVVVRLPDRYTDPSGGVCTTTCYGDWSREITLTSSWAPYQIFWSGSLTRYTPNVPDSPFDPSGLMSVQFFFPPGYAFDIYIDDVEFIP
jgi:hypothetical protein